MACCENVILVTRGFVPSKPFPMLDFSGHMAVIETFKKLNLGPTYSGIIPKRTSRGHLHSYLFFHLITSSGLNLKEQGKVAFPQNKSCTNKDFFSA